jgi:serine/threonine protein kinase
MGRVWLLQRPEGAPFDTIWGPTRAVKTFNADEDEQEAIVEQELGNWASLNSSHIVPLIKIVRLNFELGAMMEVMPGSLADYLRHYRRLEEATVKMVMLDVARGLRDAQQQSGLAHLDLKPDNLLLTENPPHVKISDWGIARIMSNRPEHTDWLDAPKNWFDRQTEDKTRFCGGTLPYMAPERLSGAWSVGVAADVFSLGIIGVELMTGRLPSADPQHPLRSPVLILSHEYLRRAKTLLSARPGALAELILRMLDPDPLRRSQDYSTLISGLERI